MTLESISGFQLSNWIKYWRHTLYNLRVTPPSTLRCYLHCVPWRSPTKTETVQIPRLSSSPSPPLARGRKSVSNIADRIWGRRGSRRGRRSRRVGWRGRIGNQIEERVLMPRKMWFERVFMPQNNHGEGFAGSVTRERSLLLCRTAVGNFEVAVQRKAACYCTVRMFNSFNEWNSSTASGMAQQKHRAIISQRNSVSIPDV